MGVHGLVSQLCFLIPGAAGPAVLLETGSSPSSSSLAYLARLATWGDAVAAAKRCSGELAFESGIRLFCPFRFF